MTLFGPKWAQRRIPEYLQGGKPDDRGEIHNQRAEESGPAIPQLKDAEVVVYASDDLFPSLIGVSD